MKTRKRFYVKWSDFYQAHIPCDRNTGKVIAGFDNPQRRNVEIMCDYFNEEYEETGQIAQLGI